MFTHWILNVEKFDEEFMWNISLKSAPLRMDFRWEFQNVDADFDALIYVDFDADYLKDSPMLLDVDLHLNPLQIKCNVDMVWIFHVPLTSMGRLSTDWNPRQELTRHWKIRHSLN